MNTTKPPLVPQIQHLRGFAVILVVFAHLHQGNDRFFDAALLDDFAYFGFVGVDIFFVISGYIIHRLFAGLKGFNLQFILERANRIYPLYWIFTCAALIGYIALGDTLTSDFGELDLLGSFSLFPTGEPPILMVGWTLTHELYFYVAYAGWLTLPRMVRPWAATGWGVVSILTAAFFPISASPWLTLATSPFNLLFLAGALLAQWDNRLPHLRWIALILTGIGALSAMLTLSATGLEGLQNPVVRVALLAPFALGFVTVALAWKPIMPTLVTQIGDWSYGIYLSHILLIGLLARLIPRIFVSSLWGGLIFFIVGFLGCITLGFIVNKLLEQPILKAGKTCIHSLFTKQQRG